ERCRENSLAQARGADRSDQAVPRDVADRDDGASVGKFESVVPIAADQRLAFGRDVERIAAQPDALRQAVGQERSLERNGFALRLIEQRKQRLTGSAAF